MALVDWKQNVGECPVPPDKSPITGEYGKYYKLNNHKSYFCVQLQRMIKFEDLLVVKCSSGFYNGGHFGSLVDTRFPGGPDYDTENEIEFGDEDIISEYHLREMKLIYSEFHF